MHCILLAAGYATRLYPLTKDRPKSLLPVAGKTILEHILTKVNHVDAIKQVNIVTNERFYLQFTKWVKHYVSAKKINVINDGTTTNDNRLGAIADINHVLTAEKIEDDILVLAGDNLFDFDLGDFISFYTKKDSDCITVHELNNLEDLKRTGVVEINQQAKVLSFVEKPEKPKSNLAVPPFYIYQKATLRLITQYLHEGNNPDAPGNFIPWLIKRKDVYAYKFTGNRYDIGNVESYNQVNRIFSKITSGENPIE